MLVRMEQNFTVLLPSEVAEASEVGGKESPVVCDCYSAHWFSTLEALQNHLGEL